MHTLNTDNDTPNIWREQLMKFGWIGGDFLVDHNNPRLINNANIKYSGVKIDTAVIRMYVSADEKKRQNVLDAVQERLLFQTLRHGEFCHIGDRI